MTNDLRSQLEFKEKLVRFCCAIRGKKGMARMAGIAGDHEVTFQAEADKLRDQIAKQETRALL